MNSKRINDAEGEIENLQWRGALATECSNDENFESVSRAR